MLAERVMRELFAWPIVLPGELVYFARTAALIEGVGSRYDRNFNSIRVASPVVMRMRRELLVALRGRRRARRSAGAVGGDAGRAWRAARRRCWTPRARDGRRGQRAVGQVDVRAWPRGPLRGTVRLPRARRTEAAVVAAVLEDPVPEQVETELHPRKQIATRTASTAPIRGPRPPAPSIHATTGTRRATPSHSRGAANRRLPRAAAHPGVDPQEGPFPDLLAGRDAEVVDQREPLSRRAVWPPAAVDLHGVEHRAATAAAHPRPRRPPTAAARRSPRAPCSGSARPARTSARRK